MGTGGESVKSLNKKPFLASTYEGYGCINVEIKGKSMNVEYYSDSNNPIDKFSITKNQQNSKSTDLKTDWVPFYWYLIELIETSRYIERSGILEGIKYQCTIVLYDIDALKIL